MAAIALLMAPWSVRSVEINDRFDDRFILNGSLLFLQATTVGATAELGEPSHFPGFAPRRSLWWEWLSDRDGYVEVNTEGSGFDTIVAVYVGASLESLTQIASSNDVASLGQQSRIVFFAEAGESYIIAADGPDGASGTLRMTVRSPLPRNDLVARRVVASGGAWRDVMTNAGASGEEGEAQHVMGVQPARSLWWEWTAPSDSVIEVDTAGSSFDTVLAVYRAAPPVMRVASGDNFLRSGGDDLAADALHDIPDDANARVRFRAEAGAVYLIAVDGAQGATGTVILTLAPSGAPAPPNDRIADATVLAPDASSASGSSTGASVEAGEPDHRPGDGLTSAASIWWTWTAPATPAFTEIATAGSGFDTVLAVYSRDAEGRFVREGWNDDDPLSGGFTSRVGFNRRPGVQYFIAVDGFAGEQGPVSLTLSHGAQPNDAFAAALGAEGLNSVLHGDAAGAGAEPGEPAHVPGIPPTRSMWWTWTAPVDGPVRFDTEGSSFDTVAAVYTGGAIDQIVPIASDDDSGGSGRSALVFDATAGTEYRFVVDAKSGVGGAVVARIAVAGNYPAWAAGIPDFVGVDAEPYRDPDDDGFPNRLEAALGLHPLLNSRPGGPDPNASHAPVGILGSDSYHLEFRVAPERVNFDRSLAPGVGPSNTARVTLWGESSTNGATWSVIDPLPLGDDVYRISLPLDSPSPMGLLRLSGRSPVIEGTDG